MINRLYVGHITQCEESDLRDFFSKWGELRTVWVARQPPGFGYVTFVNPTDAQRALFEGQGQCINSKQREVVQVFVSLPDCRERSDILTKEHTIVTAVVVVVVVAAVIVTDITDITDIILEDIILGRDHVLLGDPI